MTYEFSNEEYGLIGCQLCWRSGCASWVARAAEDEDAHAEPNSDSESGKGEFSDLDLGELAFPNLPPAHEC